MTGRGAPGSDADRRRGPGGGASAAPSLHHHQPLLGLLCRVVDTELRRHSVADTEFWRHVEGGADTLPDNVAVTIVVAACSGIPYQAESVVGWKHCHSPGGREACDGV